MIHYHIFEGPIKKYFQADSRVIELGDQEINLNIGGEHVNGIGSQEFFDNIETVSIDINGENGSLPLDLAKPIKDLPKQGDILTDFGTLEHVKSLYHGLKNAFNLLKIGGIAIHVNPLSGGYVANHGFHYFNENFWVAFCDLAKLNLIETYKEAAYHNTVDGWEQYAIYEKQAKSKFPTKTEFDKIYKAHITKS